MLLRVSKFGIRNATKGIKGNIGQVREAVANLKPPVSPSPSSEPQRLRFRHRPTIERGSHGTATMSSYEREWSAESQHRLWAQKFPSTEPSAEAANHQQPEQDRLFSDDLSFDSVLNLKSDEQLNWSAIDSSLSSAGRPHFVGTPTTEIMEKECQSLKSVYVQLRKQISALLNDPAKRVSERDRRNLQNHEKVMSIRQAQLRLTLYALHNSHTDGFGQQYSTHSRPLGRFGVPVEAINCGLNFRMPGQIHMSELRELAQYRNGLNRLSRSKSQGERNYHLNDCQKAVPISPTQMSKIYALAELYPKACMVSTDDIFSHGRSTQRWNRLRHVAQIRSLGPREDVENSFSFVKGNMNMLFASGTKFYELLFGFKSRSLTESFKDIFRGGKSLTEYLLKHEKAQRKAQLIRLDPSKEIIHKIINSDNSPMAKMAIGTVLPRIQDSKVMYLKREFPQITKQRVLAWEKDGDYGIDPEPMTINVQNDAAETYREASLTDTYDSEEEVMVRVISPFELVDHQPTSVLTSLFNNQQAHPVRSVILHIHGGGFICQNSFVHQMYTRVWAKNLNIPVVSVDYRLAPKHPFPAALDDCFQAYMWVANYFSRAFRNGDNRPPKILITGDSAGGNLATAVTALTIKLRLKVPDAVVLSYPALTLSADHFTPSRLECLDDDELLPLSMSVLKMFQESYVPPGQFDTEQDPFLSPLALNQQLLSKFPRTRIFVGENDSMVDDCYRFAEKLMMARRDVRLRVYESFIHGFLQFDTPLRSMPYCREAVRQIQGSIGRLLRRRG